MKEIPGIRLRSRLDGAKLIEVTLAMALLVFLATWLLDGRPNGGIGSQRTPIFYFSLVIYTGQGLITARYFRRENGFLETLGFVSSGLVSSVSLYELLFKLSFPLMDPSFGRLQYLIKDDLYFATLFSVGILPYLSCRRYWNASLRNRAFVASILASSLSWLLWWATCFPLDVKRYELEFLPCPWAYNVLTKLSTASAYVTILRRTDRKQK